ncbi:Scr1 family TA system antitoxin-like transcriptional regulator [Streptomyces sp. NPDC051018]|uniref:helix-turn-helix domain-containing protein n=1 Tax=Streptomyces sp. NPDC051018 TaxID=3365639 RepID=UPI0037A28C16
MGRRTDHPGEKTGATTSAALFGELLREHRDRAHLSQDKLASQIPCDRSLVAKIEAGARVPQQPFVARCDELLETGGMLARLWARVDWYSPAEHPDWFRRRAAMDAEATALREFQTQVVPGLLQTERYAQALFSRVLSSHHAEERVSARLNRQQRFLDPDGPLLIVVLDESALRNVIVDVTVMQDQYAHLLAMGRRPNIRIQVAPASQSLIRPNTSMSLITLPDGHQWVYSESLDRGHFSDDPTIYARHSQTYDVLRADALSARESAALIGDFMEGFSGYGTRAQRGDVEQEQLQRRQRRQLHRNRPRIRRRRPRT